MPADHPDRQAGADEADLSVSELHRDYTNATRALLEKTVHECRAALQRLAAGTWGTCTDCGEPIPAPRLRVRPEAEFCVRCQARAEALAPGLGAPSRVPRLHAGHLQEEV